MKRLFCLLLALMVALGLFAVPVRGAEPDYPGKSYCLIDAATGTVLLAHNEHEALAPASVTKIMTLLLIMEAIDSGTLSWQDTVTASESAAAKGGSQVYLKVGETMTVEDMVKSIAVSSANDCACAMAEHLAGSESAFVDKMNARAAQLGMLDTHFVNCTGLDDDPAAKDHKTSAYDIALMSRELLVKHPNIKQYTTIWMDSVRGGAFGLSNTNKLVRFYEGATGLKTGFTSGAGYCLSASALRNGMELIAVVMGCATSNDRFNACRGLLDYGFANYGLYTAEAPQSDPIPVRLGKQASVAAVPKEALSLLVPKGDLASLSLRITLDESLTAPVEPGQTVGELTVYKGEEAIATLPMVAAQGVERLSWADLFRQMLGLLTGAKAPKQASP